MALSGGHWSTLAQAQKLTQSHKIPGVFEEDIKRNNPLERVPVAQAAGTGLKIEWLQELLTTESAVGEADVGDLLSWGEDITYTERESTLRYVYIQRKLDRYVQNIYGTYNDYRAQMLLECEKGLKRKLGDRILYADTTYGGTPTQFDGLHALAAERGNPYEAADLAGSKLNICMGVSGSATGAALSLNYLRMLINEMKFGISEILVPNEIGIRIDAAYEEKGFAGLAYDSAGALSLLTRGISEIGMPILYFAGIPFVRTDYLVAEAVATGTGSSSNKRGVYSSGTRQYSLFAVRYGDVMSKEAGVCFAYGGTEGEGDLYELWTWDRLENYNAGGVRLDSYGTVLLGSTKTLGRIFDITDAAIVV